MFNPFRAVGRGVQGAVSKIPGVGRGVAKAPGMGMIGRGLGLGPSTPPQMGGGAMDQIRNKVAFGNMAQAGADQMGPMMQKPGPMLEGPPDQMQQMSPQSAGAMGQGPDQMMMAPPQMNPKLQMMQQKAQMQPQMGRGLAPSPQMMGRGRGQFGAYRQ